MVAAHTQHHTSAEITCASCPLPVQLHLVELQLEMRSEEPGTLKPGVTETQSTETGVSIPEFLHVDGDAEEGDALRRARRSGPPEFAELEEKGWSVPEEQGSLLDGHRQGRSGYRWSRDEGRGNNRGDEPRLSSSTFALTGDSAHNHAVVYWSGQNSSVSKNTEITSNPICDFLSKLGDARSSCSAVNRCTQSSRCALTHTVAGEPDLNSLCLLYRSPRPTTWKLFPRLDKITNGWIMLFSISSFNILSGFLLSFYHFVCCFQCFASCYLKITKVKCIHF